MGIFGDKKKEKKEKNESAGSGKVEVGLNLPFLRSKLGVLKLLEIVLCLVFCGLVNQYCQSSKCFMASNRRIMSKYPGIGFELFAVSVALIFTFILLLLHIFLATLFFGIFKRVELGFTLITSLMFLVCVCIHAAYAAKEKGFYSQFVAATIFAVLLVLLYLADSVIQYRNL